MTKNDRNIVLVAVDVRSAHNIGSMLRSCDGFGAEAFLVGICPLPAYAGDTRLPYIAQRAQKAIAKTALGAEESVRWRHADTLEDCVAVLREEGYTIVAIEQDKNSKNLHETTIYGPVAFIVGREVEGLSTHELNLCDIICEIPMKGSKESFNVSVAAAIGLYHFSLYSDV